MRLAALLISGIVLTACANHEECANALEPMRCNADLSLRIGPYSQSTGLYREDIPDDPPDEAGSAPQLSPDPAGRAAALRAAAALLAPSKTGSFAESIGAGLGATTGLPAPSTPACRPMWIGDPNGYQWTTGWMCR